MSFKFTPRIGRQVLRKGVNARTKYNTRSARSAMQDIISSFEDLIQHTEGVTPKILAESLEETFEKSKEYCPKDTKALVNSAYLETVKSRGKTSLEMGYGKGGKPEYTAIVHENLEFRHEFPTRAKFLQAALQEDERKIQLNILHKLRSIVNG